MNNTDKHFKFSWKGYKYDSSQWYFYCNSKLINLSYDDKKDLGYLAMCGNNKEVVKRLKQLLRKELKQSNVLYKCIAYFKKNSSDYYYTRDLRYKSGDKDYKLYCYKEWKNHIIENNNHVILPYQVTTGQVNPYGYTKGETVENKEEIDLNRKHTLTFTRSRKDLMFHNCFN